MPSGPDSLPLLTGDMSLACFAVAALKMLAKAVEDMIINELQMVVNMESPRHRGHSFMDVPEDTPPFSGTHLLPVPLEARPRAPGGLSPTQTNQHWPMIDARMLKSTRWTADCGCIGCKVFRQEHIVQLRVLTRRRSPCDNALARRSEKRRRVQTRLRPKSMQCRALHPVRLAPRVQQGPRWWQSLL